MEKYSPYACAVPAEATSESRIVNMAVKSVGVSVSVSETVLVKEGGREDLG